MNPASTFSKGNLEVQVMRPTRPWNMKSGALSYYMCWPTFPKWSRTYGKFSTNTCDGEFFQEDGLEGSFEIDLTEDIGMEVGNERVVEADAGDEVHNVKDPEFLER